VLSPRTIFLGARDVPFAISRSYLCKLLLVKRLTELSRNAMRSYVSNCLDTVSLLDLEMDYRCQSRPWTDTGSRVSHIDPTAAGTLHLRIDP
jgi:hypothetical protein